MPAFLFRLTYYRLFQILLSFGLLSLGAWGAYFLGQDYEDFCQIILKYYALEDRKAFFQRNLLSHSRFQVLRAIWGLGILFLALSLFYSRSLFQGLKEWVREHAQYLVRFFQVIRTECKCLSKTQLFGLGFLVLSISGLKLYYLLNFHLFLDEVFTHTFLLSRGLLVSLSYYPGPNNHIFFNVLGSIILPFTSGLFEEVIYPLRGISWLVSLGTSLLFWLYIKKNLGLFQANFLFLLFYVLPASMMYSFLARGYALLLLMTLLSYMLSDDLARGHRERPVWTAWVLFQVLGFYTLPSFLYPALSLSIFLGIRSLWNRDWVFLGQIFRNGLGVIVGVFLLYSPVILLNGDSLWANSWVQAEGRESWWGHLPAYAWEWGDFFLPDFAPLLALLVLTGVLGAFWELYRKKEGDGSRTALLFLCFILPIPLLLYLQRLLPYPRIFIYVLIPGLHFLGYLVPRALPKGWRFAFIVILGFLLYAYPPISCFSGQMKRSYIFESAKEIYAQEQSPVFVNHDAYGVYLRYVNQSRGAKLMIEHTRTKKKYARFIWDKKQGSEPTPLKESYELVFENEEFRDWRLKSNASSLILP